ncbi:MAG: hypothetical protein U9N59_01250 [Campylobacterota bacterium]|nr:hypothetical protein [Campylobacterota bacterium]
MSNTPAAQKEQIKQQTSICVLSNQNLLSITEEFTSIHSVIKRGTKQEDKKKNELTTKAQIILIEQMIENIYNIEDRGKEKFILHLGNGEVKYIERNIKNFVSIVKIHFKELYTRDGFENINLPLFFEHLKSRSAYEYREYRSPFFEKTEFIVDEKQRSLSLHIKIDYTHDLEGISKERYDDVVESIGEHWLGNIPHILDYMVAGMYAIDKKSLWFLILADSNFGKSKLFKWMSAWDGTAFIDFKDIINDGINNKKPEDYYNKVSLVIDEAMSFHRKLFEIEETLEIRPMRAHTVYVPINSRILLSADGGQFNDDFLDKQITNRVSCLDLRGKTNKDLGDLKVAQDYGHNTVKRVMSHWLHYQIVERISTYMSKSKNDRADFAEHILRNIFKKFKMDKKDFFKMVKDTTEEMLEDIETSLGKKMAFELDDFIISRFVNKEGVTGCIVKTPQTTLEKMLVKYDKTLEYELKFKKINQLVEKIDGWKMGSFWYNGKTIRGLFVPRKQLELDTTECPF